MHEVHVSHKLLLNTSSTFFYLLTTLLQQAFDPSLGFPGIVIIRECMHGHGVQHYGECWAEKQDHGQNTVCSD